MTEETTLSWDVRQLTVTSLTRSLLRRDVSHRHVLLQHVRGFAKSGSLLAIMGPSGSGKTTLLTTLGQRIQGQLDGDLMLNGRAVDKDLMRRISSFVPQQDLAVSSLTTLEHISFMTTLKLDRRLSRFQREQIVSKTMKELDLEKCCLTQISALSGGERKRVSLATEIITDPPILFCDEPTTGLDSFHASSVVTLLRGLSGRGKMVVCTIHQPASDVFTKFDQLSLLAPGGRLAYHGDAAGAQMHFYSLGLECPNLHNPADFFLSKLNSGPVQTAEICRQFDESTIGKDLEVGLNSFRDDSTKINFIYGIEEKFLKFYSVQPASQWTQLRWLSWRAHVAMFRDSHALALRLLMFVMIAFVVASPYVSTQLNQQGIQNMQGFLYSVITELSFSQSYMVLYSFPADIALMLREVNNKVYSAAPFYFSKALSLLPLVILESLIFSVIAFVTVGIKGGLLGCLIFSGPVLASAIASTAFGFCMSTMFENVSWATIVIVPLDFITLTFSGPLLQLSTAPAYLRWIMYTSRFYYGIEAMSILQWRQVKTIPCSENPEVPCVTSGEGVLYKYGFNSQHLYFDFLGLLLLFTSLHLIGFLFLKRRSKQQSVY